MTAADLAISSAKAVFMLLLVLQVCALLFFFERKVSALIQDRIGANRAAILGFAGLGLVNTLVADPLKFLAKEDVVPAGADRRLHFLAPCATLFAVLAAFATIPFGDVLEVAGRAIPLQVADLSIGFLYVLAMVSLGVYGVVLGGWASNNRLSLLGAMRGSAQLISYEIAMGLALVAVAITYGTVSLREIAHAQSALVGGWIPAWGVLYQPVGFLIFLVAGIAETKRVPFDLPEGESELVSGYFTEYSGAKYMMFFMADFVEIVIVGGLVTAMFFGGWQVPYLGPDGFHFPWGASVALPQAVVALLQVAAFTVKVIFFCWLQIVLRWTLPRLRYDQLMQLGWKGLLPLALVNVLVTAAVVIGRAA